MRLRGARKLRAAANQSQEVVMTATQHTSTAPRDVDIDEKQHAEIQRRRPNIYDLHD